MLNYSNFTRSRTIEGWPMGSNKRGTAIFTVESNKKGERGVRKTICEGRENKPKALTYAAKVAFADGSDDRTYVMELCRFAEMISVMSSDMQHSKETLFPDDERFAAVKEAILAAQ